SSPGPQFIQVQGTSPQIASDIRTALKDEVGKPIDTTRLQDKLETVLGTGRFATFSYSTTQVQGTSGLLVQVEEKEHAPPFLNLGLFMQATNSNAVRFNLHGRITALDVGGFGAEWRTDFTAGSSWHLQS